MPSSQDNAAPIIATLEEGRRQFLALVDHVRPDLHRYCARMTGSVADGEDVVQDTLARPTTSFRNSRNCRRCAPGFSGSRTTARSTT
jgi:DNA-directed RNA polymerase specialized sigma24 family protein